MYKCNLVIRCTFHSLETEVNLVCYSISSGSEIPLTLIKSRNHYSSFFGNRLEKLERLESLKRLERLERLQKLFKKNNVVDEQANKKS